MLNNANGPWIDLDDGELATDGYDTWCMACHAPVVGGECDCSRTCVGAEGHCDSVVSLDVVSGLCPRCAACEEEVEAETVEAVVPSMAELMATLGRGEAA